MSGHGDSHSDLRPGMRYALDDLHGRLAAAIAELDEAIEFPDEALRPRARAAANVQAQATATIALELREIRQVLGQRELRELEKALRQGRSVLERVSALDDQHRGGDAA